MLVVLHNWTALSRKLSLKTHIYIVKTYVLVLNDSLNPNIEVIA